MMTGFKTRIEYCTLTGGFHAAFLTVESINSFTYFYHYAVQNQDDERRTSFYHEGQLIGSVDVPIKEVTNRMCEAYYEATGECYETTSGNAM